MIKNLARRVFATFLGFLARGVIAKYHPTVIMVTGSVGKTSTKDALTAVFSETHYLRASEKSYNSEFGVPLTIIGIKNPWKRIGGWLRVLEEAAALWLFPSHYPKLLVLEVGADRPGDLARILHIATPDAVVVTLLPDIPVHVEAYPSPQAVRDEEFTPAHALAAGAPLIVCADDPHAVSMASHLSVAVKTFGFSKGADVEIARPAIYKEGARVVGMKADLLVEGEKIPLIVRGALGRPQLYAPAAALATARALSVSLTDARASLDTYAPPPGRMRLLPGMRDTTIVDDSYNASPAAAIESLSSIALLKDASRKIVVFGDMLELGRYSTVEHERVGKAVPGVADMLVTVGVRARGIAAGALEAGMLPDLVTQCQTTDEAVRFLLGTISPDDVILVKGSQGVRTERIVKALLKHEEDQTKLVRQEKEWQAIV